MNGHICNIPSAIIRPGDTVSVREKDRNMVSVVESLKGHKSPVVSWLAWDEAKMEGTLQRVTTSSSAPSPPRPACTSRKRCSSPISFISLTSM